MSRTYKDRPYRVAARQDRGPVHEWHRGCEQADPVYRRRTVVTESAPHWHEEELTVHGRPAWAYEDFDSWRLVDADGFFDAEAFEDYSDWVTTETVRRWMFGPTTEVVTERYAVDPVPCTVDDPQGRCGCIPEALRGHRCHRDAEDRRISFHKPHRSKAGRDLRAAAAEYNATGVTEVVTDDRSSGVGPFGGGWWD